jgi:hypothetical protein
VKLRSGLFTSACAVLALPLALAACEGASTNEPPASTTTAAPAATAAPTTRAPRHDDRASNHDQRAVGALARGGCANAVCRTGRP